MIVNIYCIMLKISQLCLINLNCDHISKRLLWEGYGSCTISVPWRLRQEDLKIQVTLIKNKQTKKDSQDQKEGKREEPASATHNEN